MRKFPNPHRLTTDLPRAQRTPADAASRGFTVHTDKSASNSATYRSRDDCHCDDGPERLPARAAHRRW